MPDDNLDDIHALLADFKQVTVVKAGKILEVDLARKRLSVQLTDGTHALVGAPDTFFEPGSNANVGDYYVVEANGIPKHLHENFFEQVATKVTGLLTEEATATGIPVEGIQQ